MAKTTMTLTVRMRWWVKPYLWLAIGAAYTVSPFASEDQIDAWSGAHARFIAAHGLRFGME